MHNNKISHLRTCDRYLPTSLATLTLANNNINDLNEISQLVHLTNLTSISLANNPCVCISGNSVYPLLVLDGFCFNVNVFLNNAKQGLRLPSICNKLVYECKNYRRISR